MDKNTSNEQYWTLSSTARDKDVPKREPLREQQAFPVHTQRRQGDGQAAYPRQFKGNPMQPKQPQQPVPQQRVEQVPVQKPADRATSGTVAAMPKQKKSAAPVRMPKEQAQNIATRMKRGIVVASFLSFGAFSALVMTHAVGTTTTTTQADTATTSTTTTATGTSSGTVTAKNSMTASSTAKKATTTAKKVTATATKTTTQQGGGYGFGTTTTTSTSSSGTQTS